MCAHSIEGLVKRAGHHRSEERDIRPLAACWVCTSVAILEKNWNLGLPVLMFGRDFQRAETGSRKSFMAIQVGLPTHFEVHLRLRGHPDGDPAWKSIEDQLEVRELRQKRAFNTKETLFGEYESSRQTTCCFTRFFQNWTKCVATIRSLYFSMLRVYSACCEALAVLTLCFTTILSKPRALSRNSGLESKHRG